MGETEDNKAQKRPRWTGLKHHAKYEAGLDYNDEEFKEEDGVAEKDKAAAHVAGGEAEDYIFKLIPTNPTKATTKKPTQRCWADERGKCRKILNIRGRTTTKRRIG